MLVISCKNCGKSFKRKPPQIERSKAHFCSTSCQHETKKSGELKGCFICGKEIYRQSKFLKKSQSGKFFCSKNCSLRWQNTEFVGEKHPNWINGNYSYRSVLKKAGVIQFCRLCGKDDQRILAVHHLDKNRQNNVKTNLVYLCHNCHHLAHHYLGKNFLSKIKQNGDKAL